MSGSVSAAVRFLHCPRGPVYLVVGLVALVVGYWSNPSMESIMRPDSYGYVAVAQDFSHPISRDRPPGYPLLLRALMWIAGDEWRTALATVDVLLLAILSLLLVRLGEQVGLPVAIAGLLAAYATSFGSFLGSVVMAEMLSAVALTALWLGLTLLAAPDKSPRLGSRRLVFYALLLGMGSGLVVLIKPIWLLGSAAICSGLALAWTRRRSVGVAIAGLLVGHGVVCAAWQANLVVRYGQWRFSRFGAYNLNLAVVAGGLTRESQGTALYEEMVQQGVLERYLEVRSYSAEELYQLKEAQIPVEIRADREFSAKAIGQDPWRFVSNQVALWPWFFLNRSPSPAGAFPGLPDELRYLLLGSQGWFFRPFLPALLLASLVWALRERSRRGAVVIGLGMLLYGSLVSAGVCYQGSVLMRWRIPFMPMMLALALFPLGSALTVAVRRIACLGKTGSRS